MNVENEVALRKIRSFIRRQGRLTSAQEYALTHYWDTYCLDSTQSHDFKKVFANDTPLLLEIGFGNGEALAKMAADNLDKNFIGIEVHKPGIGHLLLLLQQQGLTNVRIFCDDAVDVLQKQFPDNSLSGLHLFFPDPWPKKKHHKRRIVNAEFAELLSRKLTQGGYFHAATDWQHYAEAMLAVLSAQPNLCNTSLQQGFVSRPDYRLLTKFEQRGLRLGHGVWDLIFTKRCHDN